MSKVINLVPIGSMSIITINVILKTIVFALASIIIDPIVVVSPIVIVFIVDITSINIDAHLSSHKLQHHIHSRILLLLHTLPLL